jgi:hypothetical protein
MDNNSVWYTTFQQELNQFSFTRREYKLFNIARFIKSAKWTDSFSDQCPVCKKNKSDMLHAAREIKSMIRPSGGGEATFETLLDTVYHHIRKDHKLTPRSYFISLYSFVGMIAGVISGGLVGVVTDLMLHAEKWQWLKNGLLVGWFLGLVAGQILGKRKDNRIKKLGRQF